MLHGLHGLRTKVYMFVDTRYSLWSVGFFLAVTVMDILCISLKPLLCVDSRPLHSFRLNNLSQLQLGFFLTLNLKQASAFLVQYKVKVFQAKLENLQTTIGSILYTFSKNFIRMLNFSLLQETLNELQFPKNVQLIFLSKAKPIHCYMCKVHNLGLVTM